jgi:hypothetical protein
MRRFTAAGLPRLPSTNTAALAFLDRELESAFARHLPPVDELRAVEEALALASEGSYRPQSWDDERRALDAAIRADAAVVETVARPGEDSESISALDSAAAVMRGLAEARHAATRAMRALLEALERSQAQAPVQTAPQTRRAPVPEELAVRWLANADSSQAAARRFTEDASVLENPEWRVRLEAYAEALEAVSRSTPCKELESGPGGIQPPHRPGRRSRSPRSCRGRRVLRAAGPPDRVARTSACPDRPAARDRTGGPGTRDGHAPGAPLPRACA